MYIKTIVNGFRYDRAKHEVVHFARENFDMTFWAEVGVLGYAVMVMNSHYLPQGELERLLNITLNNIGWNTWTPYVPTGTSISNNSIQGDSIVSTAPDWQWIRMWDDTAKEIQDRKPKCTCGCTKTFGDSWPIDKHDSWCDLRENESSHGN